MELGEQTSNKFYVEHTKTLKHLSSFHSCQWENLSNLVHFFTIFFYPKTSREIVQPTQNIHHLNILAKDTKYIRMKTLKHKMTSIQNIDFSGKFGHLSSQIYPLKMKSYQNMILFLSIKVLCRFLLSTWCQPGSLGKNKNRSLYARW